MQNETLQQKSIKWVNWGIANVIEGRIYMNKALKGKQYKKLRQKLLDHEKGHSPEKHYTFWDLLHDTKQTTFDLDLIYLIITTPNTWLQFSPIILAEGKLIFDRQTFYIYTLIIISALIGWLIL